MVCSWTWTARSTQTSSASSSWRTCGSSAFLDYYMGQGENMPRAISIQELSTQLVDAYMESDGEIKAVVFVDRSNDTAPFYGVEYDKDRKCLVVRLGYFDYDVDNSAIKKEITEVNAK